MKRDTGLVHIYYGDGKGKTTTGMGLITRAAGVWLPGAAIPVHEG